MTQASCPDLGSPGEILGKHDSCAATKYVPGEAFNEELASKLINTKNKFHQPQLPPFSLVSLALIIS